MPDRPIYAIVGAGQAGGWAAATLRSEEFPGRVVVVGWEPYPPYERPPLSKDLLAGDGGPEQTYLHEPSFYRERDIELRLGVRALALDTGSRRLTLSDGETIDYDKLLLATGSRVRRLRIPGADLPGVLYLRTIEDMLAIREQLHDGVRLAVVGGGYIGLEVAAAARGRGCEVAVVEMENRVMARVVAPEMGEFYADVHRTQGVDLHLGRTVTRFEGGARAGRAVLAEGGTVEADLFVVGIGIVPDTELAAAAGLAVDDGIVVDALGRTSDPAVFAAGDVTRHPNPILGRRVRLESWQNAQNQAIAAARAMCGREDPYAEVPWFWSDQYDLNLQMVGLPETWDELVFRGRPGDGPFTAFYLEDRRVVGANAVNNARDIRFARRLVGAGKMVDPGILADPDVPLKSLL